MRKKSLLNSRINTIKFILVSFTLILFTLTLSACSNINSQDSNSSTAKESPFTYTREAYEQALSEEKTIYLDFFATWCPICIDNKKRFTPAEAAVQDLNRVIFIVDYDNENTLKDEFGIFQQSTYILIPNGDISKSARLGPGLITEEQYIELLQKAIN
jgi:thiol:disulfide interchange protein